MAYLLMFVTLLHLITLAMLFIATMEKVVFQFKTWCLFLNCYFIRSTYPAVCFVSNLSLKSWWEWEGLENSDLWYNCRFDNFTGSWLCASSKETGEQLFRSGFTSTKITEAGVWMHVGMFSFLRVAPGSAGPDGSLGGLLLRLLLGVPGSTVYHVQGRTLLLHGAVSDLCR